MGRAVLVPDRSELDECPAAAAAAHEDDSGVRGQVPVEISERGDVGETHDDLRRRAGRRLRFERSVVEGGAARRDARGVGRVQ